MTAATNSHMQENGIQFKITYSKPSDVMIYHMEISFVWIHFQFTSNYFSFSPA